MRNSTSYKLAGTKTFRRSSTKILGQWGNNLQNVEKSMREAYEPDGLTPALYSKCKYWLECGDSSVFTEEELVSLRVLVQSDESGADALIVAYDCEPLNYRKLFINGVKPHVYVAMKLFKDIWRKKLKESGGLVEDFDIEQISNLPIDKLKENPFWHDLDTLIKSSDNWSLTERYYYLAKQTVHSFAYEVQPPAFCMNISEKSGGKIVISQKDGEHFLQTIRSLFPEVPERNRRVEAQVRKHRILYNFFGFPYQITDYHIDSKMKEYYAWSPQSTVAEIVRIAFSRLQEFIESEHKKWDLLADTHDSYLVQCPLLDVIECKSKMKEFMNQELVSPVDGIKFRMKSEQNVGMNWNSYKKDKNDLGLREITWN